MVEIMEGIETVEQVSSVNVVEVSSDVRELIEGAELISEEIECCFLCVCFWGGGRGQFGRVMLFEMLWVR